MYHRSPRRLDRCSRPFLATLVLLASACSAGNELAVDVRTDLVPGEEFDSVRVTVDGEARPLATARLGDDFGMARRVAEVAGIAAGLHVIEVQLLEGATTVVRRRVSVRLEGSLIVLVVLTRDCRGVTCPGAGDAPTLTECVGGRCVDPSCSSLDPDSCGAGECADDIDCTSDVACTEPACVEGACLELPGVDTCAAGEYCQPAIGCLPIPMSRDGGVGDAGCANDADCDDGIACTTDRCAVGACARTPDDAMCTAGMDPRCDPTAAGADPATGCVATECTPATCVASGCETASCVDGVCQRATTCADGETCCGSGVCGVDCADATVCVGMTAGTVCRVATGPCDAEERCDGASPGCPADELQPSSHVCRAATGTCDAAEMCSGASADCPIDRFASLGTTCSGGTCNGLGMCLSGCTPGAPCSTGNVCEIGELDCGGASPRCVASGFASSSTVCRASSGPCDVAETCTGSSATCPSNAFAGSSIVCRGSAGACDVAETCTGSSASCPADGYRSGAFECRASGGGCDVAEFCPGSGPDCPANSFRPGTFECRASAGACDLAETCTGSSATCPTNAFRSSSTTCRASAGACDLAETCTGASASCPSDAFASGTTCRASAGVCDVAETCSGSSALCPGDALRPTSYVCRAASGACDLAETCTGASASCPSDVMSPGGGYTEACCPGSQCLEGACVGGRCAAFGGMYALHGEDSTTCAGNPLAGNMCACPPGFVDELLTDLDGNVDEGTGWETYVHQCRAPAGVAGADFRGGYGELLNLPGGVGCGASCTIANAYTGACGCPAGSTPQTWLGVHYQSGTSADCQRDFVTCRGGAPYTYGGAYRVMTDTGVVCQEIPAGSRCEPNPVTGSCTCPLGFSPVTFPAMRPHSDAARYASNWFCRADLTVCVDPTP